MAEAKRTGPLFFFAEAYLAFVQDKFAEAVPLFRRAIEVDQRLEDYARYYLAQSLVNTGDLEMAKVEYQKVLNTKATSSMQKQAVLQLADLEYRLKNFKQSKIHYTSLLKKLKNSPEYADIIWHMMSIERQTLGAQAGCKWAKELYSKYPTMARIQDWSWQMQKNTVEGLHLTCRVSEKDTETRIKRLQFGGDSAKAEKEIRELRPGADDEENNYSLDVMLAQHWISEGQTVEAMRLLLPHAKSQALRPPFWMLIGKAASRAGDYVTAIGAYEKAYKLAPRGKKAKESLFQAAFMSYQSQDYDGAVQLFEQFIKGSSNSAMGSKMSRDARWHLSWIKYLRGDYDGALQSFAQLQTVKEKRFVRKRRGRKILVVSDSNTSERARYWMAMSLLRLGQIENAREMFARLAKDPNLGFYAIAASSRLAALPVVVNKKGETPSAPTGGSPSGAGVGSTEGSDVGSAKESTNETLSDTSVRFAASTLDSSSAVETEETEDEASDDVVHDDVQEVEAGEAVAEDETLVLHDPYLVKRHGRAKDLGYLGLFRFAQEELAEIDRRTNSIADRKTLILEYQQAQEFNRSSQLGESGFGATRIRDGLLGARQLWEFSFPRAFDESVVSSAKKFSIPFELVWGIMRAESQYRPEAQSPVGAMGLMQLMPFTAKQVAGLLELKDFQTKSLIEPDVNILLGARYLSRLYEKFSASVPLVAASYNAGPHRVYAWLKGFGHLDMDEFIEHIPFIETRNYAKKVVRHYQIYHLLYGTSSTVLVPKAKKILNKWTVAAFAETKSSAGPESLAVPWLVRPVGIEVSDSIVNRETW